MKDKEVHPMKEAREARNLSQLQLAEETGLSAKTIWNAEHNRPISAHCRRQLCTYFQMSSEELGLVKEESYMQRREDSPTNMPSTNLHTEQPMQDNSKQFDTDEHIINEQQSATTILSNNGLFVPISTTMQLVPSNTIMADCATLLGGKLAYLVTIVEDYCGQPMFCLKLQERIGKELNSMQPKSDDEGYTISRRQLLITLATLPTALLLTMLQGRLSAGKIEHLLTRCATSLVACWHLMRGSEYAVVEELLPTYLPLLASLAQESSKYQSTAASLATQGYRLKGILALHRNDIKTRDASFQQAVYYAEIAQNPGLLVAALISLAYHKPNSVEAEQLYQKAIVYEQAISSLQRSRLYAELSVACAQQNRENDAIQYLHLAQQEYPAHPENDPSFLYAEFSPSSMILEKGRVQLALTQHHPNGHYPQQAWETFASIEVGPSKLIISERIRYEIVNYQAETALALRDRDLCYDYVKQGSQGAVLLGSARRREEIIATANKALKLWPHDGRVKELKCLFA